MNFAPALFLIRKVRATKNINKEISQIRAYSVCHRPTASLMTLLAGPDSFLSGYYAFCHTFFVRWIVTATDLIHGQNSAHLCLRILVRVSFPTFPGKGID